MRPKLILRTLTLFSLLGIAALSIILYALAGTTRGSQWLLLYIDGLSDTWGLSAQNISGSLLHGLTLNGFSFATSQTISVNIERLRLEWQPQSLLIGAINVSPFEAEGIEVHVASSGKTDEKTSASYDSYNLRLPVAIAMENVQLRDIVVTTPDSKFELPDLSLEEGTLDRKLEIQQLNLSAADYSLTVRHGAVATASPFESELEIAWRLIQSDSITLEGRGKLQGTLQALAIEHVLTSPVTVESAGTFRSGLLTRQSPNLELINKISDSHWAYGQNRAIRIPTAVVELQGWLDDYSLHANGLFNTPDFPEIGLELTGNGNLAGLQINNLAIRGLDGSLAVTGKFSWQPEVSWDLKLQAVDVNPGVHWKNWPGRLAMQGIIKGEYTADTLESSLRIDSLTGTLRNYPLQASGNVGLKNGQWSSQGLKLKLGKNSITLSGSIGDNTIAAQWDADLPNLAALWPGLGGRLVGQGTFENKTSRLKLTGELLAENLKYQNYSAGFINLGSVSSTSQRQANADFRHSVQIKAGNLNINGFEVTDLQSELNGNLDNHKLLADLSTQYGALSLEISGRWHAQQWQATLHRATMRDTSTDTWQLQMPSSLLISADIRSLTETCWRQNQAVACISGRVDDSEINANAMLNEIPLNLAKPWLPVNLEIHGQLNGRLQIAGSPAAPEGSLLLEPGDGYFLVRQPEGEPESYPWRNARLQTDFANDAYNLTAGLQLPDRGSASASIKLDAQKQLNGKIGFNFTRLAWLEAWIPTLTDIQGALDAELYLSGTLNQPQWQGSAELYRASTTITGLGIDLKELALTLDAADGNQVSIQGSAKSGPGHIAVDGRLDKTAGQLRQLALKINGERFEVLNIPEAHVLATPELTVNASNKLIYAEGSILLPEVDIRLQDLPARAVRVSEDVVIVNKQEAETENANGIPIKTNIKLILGDQVHFNGFGFEAQLSGSLDLVEDPGHPTLAYGTLSIDEGRYKAYGQNLSVERGKLIFQGPYDNPGLDIRAVRKTPEVTVGLDIGGTLKDIHSTVFSEPALPDSEAVSILLTGKSLSNANKSEAGLLVNAIASLGIKKSRPLTSQLSETFGLDVLTIDSESGLEQSSLMIGKYLTPRLYVRYAIGLFDQLSKLELEYRLSEHIMIEAKSGKDQSMDIIYRIER